MLLASILFLCSCIIVHKEQEQVAKISTEIQVQLHQYKQSDFKQVEATFLTHQSKALVFRVLSDINKISQWLQQAKSIEVLAGYNNHQYLLRMLINSPWPFKNRELITCVNTFFDKNITTIKIFSCSDRVPINDRYVRLQHIESSWKITKISDTLVKVHYKAWLDPEGVVPAFLFNSKLIDSTEVDLKKLQIMINNASIEQYSY